MKAPSEAESAIFLGYTVRRIKFGPRKFRTKIEICDFSVEKFGPKIISGFGIFGEKLSNIKNFDKVRHG